MDMSFTSQLPCYLLAVLFLSMLGCSMAQDEEEPPISVSAPVTAVPLGDSAEIECSVTGNATFAWYRGINATDATKIPQNTTLRIHANLTTGQLIFQNTILSDTGSYSCLTDDKNHSMTAELHVYEKPTYFTEGMIIMGINAALVLLFVICGIHTYHQKRQQRKLEKEKPKRKVLTEL